MPGVLLATPRMHGIKFSRFEEVGMLMYSLKVACVGVLLHVDSGKGVLI